MLPCKKVTFSYGIASFGICRVDVLQIDSELSLADYYEDLNAGI